VFDGRGRPIQFPQDPAERREHLLQWAHAIGAYSQ
jgi:hypothetical protein